MLGLRSAKQVLRKKRFLARQMGKEIVLQRGELPGRHRLVGLAPPDGAFGLGIADREFVLRRSASVLAGFNNQRSFLGQYAFASLPCEFDARCGGEVPVYRSAAVGRSSCGE